jgi:hypothetical protein
LQEPRESGRFVASALNSIVEAVESTFSDRRILSTHVLSGFLDIEFSVYILDKVGSLADLHLLV